MRTAIKLIFCILIFCVGQAREISAQPFGNSNFLLASSPDDSSCKAVRAAVGQGNYEEAERLLKRCLDSGAEEDAQRRAENLLLGAEIEYYLEKNAQSADYAALVEDYYAALPGEKQTSFWWLGAKLKNVRGSLESEAGRYESAIKFYREGVAILDAATESAQITGGEPRRLKAELLSGISYVKLTSGLYSEAVENLEAGLAELGDSEFDDYTRASILNDFGHSLNEQGSNRQAIGYLEKAATIWQRQKDWRNYAMTEQNLGIAFRGLEDYEKARGYFERIQKAAAENAFIELETLSLQGLASLRQTSGEHRQAIEILHKALTENSSPLRRAEILWRLSTSQIQTGETEQARVGATECYDWATAQKAESLRYLCATSLGKTYLEDSPATAEKWFQTSVEITERLSRKVAGQEPEKVYFMADKPAAYHELIKLLVRADKSAQALAVSEKLKSRVLREKLQSRASKILSDDVSVQTLNLPAETVVVSYVLTDKECFAFVLKANKSPKIVALPVGASELRERIGRYRDSILKFSPALKREARALYESLLKAADGSLAKAKRLIVVPDDALWELPFQSLINPASGRYLAEEQEITYAPALGVLSGLNSADAQSARFGTNKFVAFANSSRKDFTPLREAEREAVSSGELYSPSKVFVKSDATKNRFKSEAAQADVLHLAVHGEIDRLDPFASALFFTEDTAASDDGRLTIAEILRLDLPGSLVILSSCDTSSGQVASGEGLLSLSWAFLSAGGRSVVAAQWAVEEKTTADLMIAFHRALKKEPAEPAKALRAAQIAALKRPAPFNHPFYWASFVEIGGFVAAHR